MTATVTRTAASRQIRVALSGTTGRLLLTAMPERALVAPAVQRESPSAVRTSRP